MAAFMGVSQRGVLPSSHFVYECFPFLHDCPGGNLWSGFSRHEFSNSLGSGEIGE